MSFSPNNQFSRNLNARLSNQQSRFSLVSQDTAELRSGGGCISIFGLPFFGAGFLMLLITAQLVRVSNAADLPFFVWPIIGFMGLVFTFVGGALIFVRSWLVLDRNHRRVIKSWGLLKPLKQTEFDLDNYDTVLIRLHRGDSDTPDTYPLSLRSITRDAELSVSSYQSYGAAVEQAEFLRDFLSFKVEDLSTDHPTLLKPSGEQTTQAEDFATAETQHINPPPDMKCRLTLEGDKLSVWIPPRPLSLMDFIGSIIPLAIIFVFLLPFLGFFARTNTPLAVQIFFGGFFGIFFILIPLLTILSKLSASRGSSQLNVNRQTISIDYPTPKRSIYIPLTDLIGLDYATRDSAFNYSHDLSAESSYTAMSFRLPGSSSLSSQRRLGSSSFILPDKLQWLKRFIPARGLIFKTKSGFYYFGTGLPDPEIFYLHQEFTRHLATL